VSSVDVWTHSGSAEPLDFSVRALRADVVAMKRQQRQHSVLLGTVTEDVARLNGDVSVLKADVAELKLDVAELLVLMRETLHGLPADS
jgi:hypothetical protein